MRALSLLFFYGLFLLPGTDSQGAFDREFNPFVYSAVRIPFKNNNYAKDWFGSDVAFVQSPLLAAGKPSKPGNPVPLPTIAPYIVSWKKLEDVHVNEENVQNFEKRIDTKVWWPNRRRK